MYLSRIKLNTQKRETMKALVNPQQIHGAIEVLNGEPSEASDAADEKNRARSLWRIDTLGGEMYLLVLTQDRPKLSRAAEQRQGHRPMLSDLRESGAIEQDADVVMFLYREGYYNRDLSEAEQRVAEVIIAKQRNGPIGTVNLLWIPELTKFSDMERSAE